MTDNIPVSQETIDYSGYVDADPIIQPNQADRREAVAIREAREASAEAFEAVRDTVTKVERLVDQVLCDALPETITRHTGEREATLSPFKPDREAVARELHRRFYAVVTGHDDCREWEDMPEHLREAYLDGADAAIALLALPTDPVQSGQEEEVADAVHEELWKVDAEVAMLRSIADRLVDQQDEPWPDGSESDRLHYWRDKAIHASRDIHSALSGTAPATTGGE